MNYLRKMIRQHKANQVVAVGKHLRQVEIERSSISNEYPHTQHDAEFLDREIARLARKRESLLTYIRTTA